MLVVVEYIPEIKIEDTAIPVYVTDDSRIYVVMEIMPYLKTPRQVKQTIITDKDGIQYDVYPILEVFKFIKNRKHVSLDTSSIYKKQHTLIPNNETTESEFALTIKRIMIPKKKK